MKIAIVMTTIHNPKNLDLIIKNISPNDHIVIATDRKTPNLQQNVHIVDIKKQIAICKNPLGVPFDCIQRRNIGYLYAIKYLNPEAIITIDDDNFPDNNWITEHKNNIGQIFGNIYDNPINIINEFLKISCDFHDNCFNVNHRGVSFEQSLSFKNCKILKDKVEVAINAGLWVGDPDINAYDRILHPNVKSKYKNSNSIILNPQKWFHPFNSQNTIFHKKVFPAIFLIPMYEKFYGYKIGRFDDIWQSYICQKIMSHHNLHVRFGSPIVKQDRNKHNIVNDLNEEYPGLIFTTKLIKALNSIELLCSSVLENMYEIADYFLLHDEEILRYIGRKILWWLTELKP